MIVLYPADPVTGIPVCSTSLNNNIPYQVVQHNYNLLVHSHVLPHFQHATVATSLTDTPQRSGSRHYNTYQIRK